MSTVTNNKEQRKQRIKLIVIIALFAGPVFAAWLWHVNSDQWRPAATTNYGELITPARPLADFSMPQLDGTLVNQDSLRGHWTLVYIGAADCDLSCQKNLYNIRQIRIALNEKIDRLERLWIITDMQNSEPLSALLSKHPGLQVLQPAADQLPEFLQQFQIESDAASASASVRGRVYIIDPLGNLMMRYPADADPKAILKDILRLLKTSWIG